MGPVFDAMGNPKICEDKITLWCNPSNVITKLGHDHPPGKIESPLQVIQTCLKLNLKLVVEATVSETQFGDITEKSTARPETELGKLQENFDQP